MSARVQWKRLSPEEAQGRWDQVIQQFPDWSLGQTLSWGEHKTEFGWHPYRIVAERDGQPVFAVQALFKPLRFGIGMVWTPGGPLGDYALLGEFSRFLRSLLPARMFYLRVRPPALSSPDLTAGLRSQLFTVSPKSLSSDQTMWLELDQSPEKLMEGMSTNWRHNLRRSAKHGLKIARWEHPKAEEMYEVYQAMQSYKSLDEQFSLEQIRSLLKNFGEQLVLIRCENAEGKLLAFRGGVALGKMGWDLFAAASPDARKVYASYGTLWALLTTCRELGVRRYDLMGVDPVANPGVYNFKLGTGAREIRLVGEWEMARPKVLAALANWKLSARGGSL